MQYNATAITFDADGEIVSRGLAQTDDEGRVLRTNGHWIGGGVMGTPAYEQAWLNGQPSFVRTIEVREDGGAAYRNALGMAS